MDLLEGLIEWGVFFLIIPVITFLVFLFSLNLYDGTDKRRAYFLKLYFLIPWIIISLIGLGTIFTFEINYLTIVMIALAQSLPITISTFFYSEHNLFTNGLGMGKEFRDDRSRMDTLEQQVKLLEQQLKETLTDKKEGQNIVNKLRKKR